MSDALNLEVIKTRIKEIVFATCGLEPEDIADDANFIKDLGLDSLTMMEIGVDIDQEYDLDLQDEEMKLLHDVNASAALVMEKLSPAIA
ncbi:MAG: acyl carrier protein [Acidobacteriota bacterium]|nr:acyl carrier protein [Acidobacteriota bacterium]